MYIDSKARRLVSALGADKDPSKMEVLLANLGRELAEAVLDGDNMLEFEKKATIVEQVRAIQAKLYLSVSGPNEAPKL